MTELLEKSKSYPFIELFNCTKNDYKPLIFCDHPDYSAYLPPKSVIIREPISLEKNRLVPESGSFQATFNRGNPLWLPWSGDFCCHALVPDRSNTRASLKPATARDCLSFLMVFQFLNKNIWPARTFLIFRYDRF